MEDLSEGVAVIALCGLPSATSNPYLFMGVGFLVGWW
jgi:hypothetical protein